MLSVKQGGIKYHFLRFWYDSTWDWTPVARAIGEHSTTKPMIIFHGISTFAIYLMPKLSLQENKSNAI